MGRRIFNNGRNFQSFASRTSLLMVDEVWKPVRKIGIVTHSIKNFWDVLETKMKEDPRLKRKHFLVRKSHLAMELGDTLYFYVFRPEDLRGRRGYDLEFHGLWFDMNRIDEIEDEYNAEKASR